MTDLINKIGNEVEVINDLTEEEFEEQVNDWLQYYLSDENLQKETESILEILNKAERLDLINKFIDMMTEANSEENTVPYICKLLTYNISEDVLTTINQVKGLEYYPLVDGLMEMHDENAVWSAITKIKILFPDDFLKNSLIDNDLRNLLAKAEDLQNISIKQYIGALITVNTKKEIKKPYWIVTKENEPIKTHKELVEKLVIPEIKPWVSSNTEKSVQRDVNYLVSLIDESIDLESAREDLTKKMSSMSAEERMENINWLRKNNSLMQLELEEEIFKVLGACLPWPDGINLEKESKDPCALFGGCRVWTCYENENINEDTGGDIIEDVVDRGLLAELEWFKGQCDGVNCQRKISYKHWAVRMPLEIGGWIGCYCSFECIRNDVESDNEVRMKLINGFEEIYNTVGIYDRVYI